MIPEHGFQIDPQVLSLAQARPFQVVKKGTEFIRHFGKVEGFRSCEDFYVETREWFLQRSFSREMTSYFVVWGLTGSGKQLALSNISLVLEKDPILLKAFAEEGKQFRQVCTHFASSANLARVRGLIDPSHGHGHYTDEEYRQASIIHTQYTIGYANNYEMPTLVSTEPSGPTAEFEPDGTMKGTDRAISTIRLLGEKFRDSTKILVLLRGEGVLDKISQFRGKLFSARWQDIPDILANAHLKLSREGKILDLTKFHKPALLAIKEELVDSMAPPEGIKRSNDQTYAIMGGNREEDFWPKFLMRLGFTISDFTLVRNEVSDEDFTLNLDLLEKYDPMLEDINRLRACRRQRKKAA